MDHETDSPENRDGETCQLDLTLPSEMLQQCLRLPTGMKLSIAASTHADSQLMVLLQRDLSGKIRMLFTGLQRQESNIWKCHIDSIQFDAQHDPEIEEHVEGGSPCNPRESRRLQSRGKRRKPKRLQPNANSSRSKTLRQKQSNERGKKRRSRSSAKLVNYSEDVRAIKDETQALETGSDGDKDPFEDETWHGPSLEEGSSNTTERTCQTCGREFQTIAELCDHVKIHKLSFAEYQDLIQEGKIKDFAKEVQTEILEGSYFQGDSLCNICGQGVEDDSALKKHLNVHGLTLSQYKCMVTQSRLKSYIDGVMPDANEIAMDDSELLKKEEENNQLPEKCQICHRFFRTKMSLWNHIRKHDIDSYKYQSLLTEGNLDAFLKLRKSPKDREPTSKKRGPRTKKKGTTTTEEGTLKCPICDKSCSVSSELEEHLNCDHLEEAMNANVVDTMDMIRQEKVSPKDLGIIRCPACQIQFPGSQILHHIKEAHSTDADYPALRTECSTMLEVELKKVRTGNFSQQCPLCAKEVKQRFLRAHIAKFCAKNPDKITLLKCRRCGYNTMDKQKLEEHQRKHDPSEVFMCHVCGKSYQHSSGLTRHERGVHKIFKRVPLKPFVCQQCGKSYLLKNQFQLHLVTHTDDANIMCHICGKMFKRQKAVNHHIKTQHLNIYPYQCQKCGYGMERRSTYKSHKCDGTKRNAIKRPKHPSKRSGPGGAAAPTMSTPSNSGTLKTGDTGNGATDSYIAKPLETYNLDSSQMPPYFFPRCDLLNGTAAANMDIHPIQPDFGGGVNNPVMFSQQQSSLVTGGIS